MTKQLLLRFMLFSILTAPALAENSGAESDVATATFSMYCYWTGEATLGKVDGVVASRIGHWGGKEIVQVDYDPKRTDVAELTAALQHQRSFYSVLTHDSNEREVTAQQVGAKNVSVQRGKPHFIEPKHSLRTRYPDLAKLDLTEAQAIALNTWSYFGGSMPDVLTEEQQQQFLDR